MKWLRYVLVGLALGLAYPLGNWVSAQIVPALPFQLQNGTTADATQVMANFNQILNSINSNSAKNGSNSDITALLGLTTPLAPSVGGTTIFTGGVSGGTPNAQTVTPVVPSTFSLVNGTHVVFVAGNTNTGLLQLNVAGTGLKNVNRITQFGSVPTVGGEVLLNAPVEAVYDGTQYVLLGSPIIVGEVKDFTGISIPVGHLVADGSCVSQTTYATLFTVASTAYGSCAAGLFALPDLRGRTSFSLDSGGSNRLPGALGCNSTTMGAGCGVAGVTISVANLPATTWPNSLGVTRTGSVTLSAAAGNVVNAITGGSANMTGGGGALQQAAITVVDTQAFGVSGSVTSGGSGTTLSVINPGLMLIKIIKY